MKNPLGEVAFEMGLKECYDIEQIVFGARKMVYSIRKEKLYKTLYKNVRNCTSYIKYFMEGDK